MQSSFSVSLVLAALIGGAFSGAGSARAGGPSFDCTAAMLPAEAAICSDPNLAQMDVIIAKAYRHYTPEFGDKTAIGRALIADRNACGHDVACIASVEVNALETYQATAEWATAYMTELVTRKAASHAAASLPGAEEAAPATIGACAMTHIAGRGSRFSETIPDEDNGEGSRVGYVNGVSLVSYDHEAAIVDSRLGDQVVTCLISTPRDCPAGDDRGKGYITLNLRTKGVWNFGDSQHMCGGA
jgi:uncharacterized protein